MKLKNFIHNSLIAGLLICPLLFAGCTNSVGPNDKPNDNIKSRYRFNRYRRIYEERN